MMGKNGDPENSRSFWDENCVTKRNYGGWTGPSEAWGGAVSCLGVKERFLRPRAKVAFTRKSPALAGLGVVPTARLGYLRTSSG